MCSEKTLLSLLWLTSLNEVTCLEQGERSFQLKLYYTRIWIAWVNDINCIKLGTLLTFSWINNKRVWIGGWRHQLYYHSVGPVQYVGSRNEKWIAALCTQFSIRLLAFFLDSWWVDCMEIQIFFMRESRKHTHKYCSYLGKSIVSMAV